MMKHHVEQLKFMTRCGTQRVLQEVVDDFMPPTYPLEVELQTLVAVLECTSKALLPEKYRTMDRETIVRRVDELSHLVK